MIRKTTLALISLITIAGLLLSACSQTPPPTAQPTAAPQATTPPKVEDPAKLTGQLEIFSWWTGGGEADGLAQMFKIYSGKYPNVEIVNATVAGGAGSNAKAVLKTRMLGGDPPDSFQVHAGQEIADWVKADKMEPLDDLYAAEGWDKAFPKDLLDILRVDGHYYSVPVNIHRSNVLWYNKKVFEQNGLSAPVTFEDFFKVAETLKAKGVTPLALGDNGPWAAAHLFEDILVGALGPEAYKALWTGASWDDPKVTGALETFKKMLAYVNEDHAALSWDQAAQYVIDGKAAMTIMGDWADGYFVSKNFTDYGWAPSPGSGGTFVMLSDSFGLPKGAPHRDNALAWLKVCGSFEGQEAFNPLKGSIPARTDGGKAKYDAYLQSAMKDWATNKLAPSVAHGAAAPEGWVTSYVDAIGVFVTKQDVAATQKALLQACQDAGGCTQTASAAPPKAAGQLEIFSWWTGGGEADGLAQMFKIYSGKYPDVEIINATVAGGAGSNAKAVLKTRMLGGDPPDSFQVHAGQEIADWVKADKMEPLDDLYAAEGWDRAFPKDLLDILRVDGHYYSVPVNIHRSNVLWYNKKVFEQNGLSAPVTFEDFFKVAETLKAKGITPLALGDNGPWAAAHLFEDILVGALGPEAYKALWTGASWDDPKVTEALETFKKMLAYINEDHAALSWDQAAQYVIDGKAAMTIMGDWADGYFVSKNFTDYGWAPSPGSGGTFVMLSDSFGLPKGAPHRDNALAWLKVCGSFEGQEAFNPLKGSIPARTDGGKAKYDAYLMSAMTDWATNKLAPSVAHGAAAPEGWVTSYVDAIGVFVTKQDVAATQKALLQACQDAGGCTQPAATAAAAGGKLEVFSWWTGGGEADGLAQMFKIYNQRYPGVEIINATVAGGAGSNAKAVLKTRMLGGDPPDSFQVHAGQEIADWVKADKMEPLDDLYTAEGWDRVFPKDLLDILRVNGHYYSVPVNIHRSNVLWYNKKVFADNSLQAPKTFDDFFKAAETLKAKGITPLALGDNGPWAAAHLFEDILVGTLGPEAYTGLWNGSTNWADPKVTEALETFKKMLAYVNEDHAALSWDQAAQYVIDGKAAMTIMGDWADGYFVSKNFTDYGWAPSPGSGGTFVMLSDSFGLPKGAPNRDNALAWLKVCGSFEGQEAFNPLKGSIPGRVDGGKARYDAYLQSAMKDWSTNKLAPSVAHGAAAPEGWVTSYVDTIGVFVTKQDVAAAQKALVTACQDAGVCK